MICTGLTMKKIYYEEEKFSFVCFDSVSIDVKCEVHMLVL